MKTKFQKRKPANVLKYAHFIISYIKAEKKKSRNLKVRKEGRDGKT